MPAPLSSPRVLVVDDDPRVRRTVSRLLVRHGAETVAAPGVRTAIELLRSMAAPPDLIITELTLPEERGEVLLRHVRSDARLARIPVVAMSADSTDQAFDLRLEKPFARGELRAVLRLVPGARGHDDGASGALRRLLPSLEGPGPAARISTAIFQAMVRCVVEQALSARGA